MKIKHLMTMAAAIALSASLLGCSSGTVKAEEDDSYSSGSYSSSSSSSSSHSGKSKSYSSSSDDALEEGVYSDGDATYITDGKGNTYAQDSDGNSYIFREDGSSLATDNNGNAVYDSDGDGSADIKSTDNGKSWDKL